MYIILFIKGNENTISAFNKLFYHHKMRDIPESEKSLFSFLYNILSGYFHFGNNLIFPRKAKKYVSNEENNKAVVLVKRTQYKYAVKVSVEIYCFKQYEIIRYFFKNGIGVTDMIDVL